MNPYDDRTSLDVFVDWLIAAGNNIQRIDDFDDWCRLRSTRLPPPLRPYPKATLSRLPAHSAMTDFRSARSDWGLTNKSLRPNRIEPVPAPRVVDETQHRPSADERAWGRKRLEQETTEYSDDLTEHRRSKCSRLTGASTGLVRVKLGDQTVHRMTSGRPATPHDLRSQSCSR